MAAFCIHGGVLHHCCSQLGASVSMEARDISMPADHMTNSSWQQQADQNVTLACWQAVLLTISHAVTAVQGSRLAKSSRTTAEQ